MPRLRTIYPLCRNIPAWMRIQARNDSMVGKQGPSIARLARIETRIHLIQRFYGTSPAGTVAMHRILRAS
jgi:hypothetical protein